MAVNDWPEVCALWLQAGEAYRTATGAALAGWDCFYCGDPAQSVDHVVARSHGGGDDPMNLVPVCRPCNGSKSAKSVEEWAAQIRAELGRVARKRRQLAVLERMALQPVGRLPLDPELEAIADRLDELIRDAA